MYLSFLQHMWRDEVALVQDGSYTRPSEGEKTAQRNFCPTSVYPVKLDIALLVLNQLI